MTVLLTLTTAGTDSGPFDLYSSSDAYTVPFETNISKALLVAGYTSSLVPDFATTIRVVSLGNCLNSTDIVLSTTTTTTSSTTTTTTTAFVCDLIIASTVTQDPTNQAGNNGTATITFEGGTLPFTYTLNGVPQGTATSPLTINNLSGSTSYTVVITDSLDCTQTAVFQLGETSFNFNADYIMLTYEFTDGDDLDTRTRMAFPDVGQNTQDLYLGWAVQSVWPNVQGVTPVLTWGFDNTGTGFESVLIDVNAFTAQNPGVNSFVIDARCFWFNQVGINPVTIAATLWKGGTPVKDGCIAQDTAAYCWTNPTADSSFNIDSVGIVITDNGASTKRFSAGTRAATLTYSLVTFSGVLNNNDTTTPEVLDL